MSIRYRDKNGAETVVGGLTPGGELAFGASTTRSGTTDIPSTAAGTSSSVAVTFAEAMPDNQYEIVFHGTVAFVIGRVTEKTANGFTVQAKNISSTATTGNLDWYAYKLYDVEHAEQNASDIADIKAKIPLTASSSNKLATAKDVSDLSSAVDERLDDLEDAVPVDASITNQLVSTSTMNTALGGKQDTLEFDDTPTAGSDNPVTSDGIKDAIDDVEGYVDDTATDIYEVMGKNGAKNFISISNILSEVVVNGGITFTPNSNESITVNGTSTGNPARTTSTRYTAKDLGLDENTKYIFSKGITSNQPRLELILRDSNDNVIHNYNLQGASELEVLLSDYTYEYIELRVSVSNGTTVNNVTIYPMIRDARDTDSTYQPYAMTNQQMTPYVQSVSNPNLLDNPWFTVNQRGLSTLSSAGFLFDRWMQTIDIGTLNALDNGVEVDATSNPVTFAQKSSVDTRLWDGTSLYTWSIDFTVESVPSTGSIQMFFNSNTTVANHIYQTIEVVPTDVAAGQRYLVHGTRALTTDYDVTKSCALVWLYLRQGWKIIIHSIKVEKGTASTLANDTAPNYQQELVKCQRYYYRTQSVLDETRYRTAHQCIAINTNALSGTSFPVTMRATPTVTVLHCHHMMGTTDISGTTAPIRLADGVSYFMNTNNPFTIGDVYALDFEASADL